MDAARYCLMDALGCAVLALANGECQRHLGPVVDGALLPGGARVPGTDYELDPVQAAYNIGCLIRWLDYNDTWLAAEWGHPSDNLGMLLACADYLDRGREQPALQVHDLLNALIKAYEIQGVLALENSFNREGIDHVILVRVASAAVSTRLLGGNRTAVINAVSNAFVDGGALRTYRHGANTGWRKSWAAGDATARGVRLALLAVKGEMGYPRVLSAPRWGLQATLLNNQALTLARPLGSYVAENILFKVAFPAEFHAQTAAECALQLHPKVKDRLDAIQNIVIHTQAPALCIIDKQGPLRNPADRDHCLQYIVAVSLLYGELTSRHYEDAIARDPRIDRLRSKMQVLEEPRYSADYSDPDKRSIANAVTIHFHDHSVETLAIEYPLGHRRRRAQALPLLIEKFRTNLAVRYPAHTIDAMTQLFMDRKRLEGMRVRDWIGLWTGEEPQ